MSSGRSQRARRAMLPQKPRTKCRRKYETRKRSRCHPARREKVRTSKRSGSEGRLESSVCRSQRASERSNGLMARTEIPESRRVPELSLLGGICLAERSYQFVTVISIKLCPLSRGRRPFDAAMQPHRAQSDRNHGAVENQGGTIFGKQRALRRLPAFVEHFDCATPLRPLVAQKHAADSRRAREGLGGTTADSRGSASRGLDNLLKTSISRSICSHRDFSHTSQIAHECLHLSDLASSLRR